MSSDLLYQLALADVSNIGCVQAKILMQHFGEAKSIFTARQSQLEKIEGIGSVRAGNIKRFNDFKKAESEIKFLHHFHIQPLFIRDKAYPQRLLNCYDSPTLLFYKGIADLNAEKVIAVVGTRSHTEYSKRVTDKLIEDLAAQNVLIISGMAYGVDAIAHKAALRNKLPTAGVLAHGLDQIYPPDHAGLAKDILKNNGGLLTEFRSNTKPDKHNFPTRNRVVAGMSDATIVIESGIKGGSMVTAELANGYNKDVFAFPGRVTDSKSAGCNYLIRSNKAILITDAQQLLEIMGWDNNSQKYNPRKQKEIFIELSQEEKVLIALLRDKDTLSIDEINIRSGLSSSKIAAAILNLEIQNVLEKLPGKIYRLL